MMPIVHPLESGRPHHNPNHDRVRSFSCSAVSLRSPSAICRGWFGSFSGFAQQSGTPSDRVQNTGRSGASSMGRQYRSPRSKFTTEQSRPVAADTSMSTGVRWNTGKLAADTTTAAPATTPATTGASGPQPDSSGDTTSTNEAKPKRMKAGLASKGKQTVGGDETSLHMKPSGLPPPRAAAMFRRPN